MILLFDFHSFEYHYNYLYRHVESNEILLNMLIIKSLLVSEHRMVVDDEPLLFILKLSSLDIWPEVVSPPEAAAFPAPVEAGELRELPPSPTAMLTDVIRQCLVLLRCPRPLLHSGVSVAARRPPHCRLFAS